MSWEHILGIVGLLIATWGLGHEMGQRAERKANNANANYAAKVRRSTMHDVNGGRRA
jgi:hypothetical protein